MTVQQVKTVACLIHAIQRAHLKVINRISMKNYLTCNSTEHDSLRSHLVSQPTRSILAQMQLTDAYTSSMKEATTNRI